MVMDELRRALALLSSQGFEFTVFVKQRDPLRCESVEKDFSSESFTSSSIERDPRLAFNPPVNRRKITVYEANIQPTMVLQLDQPISIRNYLCTAFKLLRQVPCKAIAKLWIKIIEPRKKTRFPYIKGDAKKPVWWPKDVEHKEPDHLHKADRLNLMCTIIADVLPQMPNGREILNELLRVTVAMIIFKKENVKRVIIKNVFEVAKCLCDKDFKHETLTLADLNDLAQKQKKRCYRHPLNVNELVSTEEDLPQQPSESNFLRSLQVEKNDTAYLSREHSKCPVSESYQDKTYRPKSVPDFDPLFLIKLDDLNDSDSLYSSDDPGISFLKNSEYVERF
ncbi:hypothetical protein SKDZ_04G3430 [Saccharomyces kudriavzevii ZP591]|uniref:YDR124W-like protein n=1 Tax=Saccharomyces cerevisiae x Saccharomyces kudriavzevii (strain VIN7) TaxID=1095631 RepID=H0GSR7_SACCK|nr:YDR124W-like protein [Saccharomyces cerevisiae x Saccharomyces kudriavzevii VIN7]CAI4058201.1 hypothetical protein SKDZ_04G3430 [Saccharomyces kudriavzevii ZP591]